MTDTTLTQAEQEEAKLFNEEDLELLSDRQFDAPISQEDFEGLGELLKARKLLENIAVKADELSAKAKKRLQTFDREFIPNKMDNLGLTEFKTNDGRKLKIAQFYNVGMPEDTREQAYQWLVDNNYGDIIKHEVTIKFGRSEREQAIELERKLRLEKLPVSSKEKIEPQTLQKFVREYYEAGNTLPEEYFEVFSGKTAKFTKA